MSGFIQNLSNAFGQMPAPTRYLLLACMAVAVVVLIPRALKKAKWFTEAISDKKYRKNPASLGLTSTQLAALNVGLINAEQTMLFVDSLTTGRDKKLLVEELESYYDIGPQSSAEKILNWLYSKGHRVYFDIIQEGYSDGQGSTYIENLTQDIVIEEQSDTGDNLSEPVVISHERLKEFKSNLEESIADLKEAGFINAREDIASVSIAAWDMGRLVTVARFCFDCGYITEERAWQIIESAYAESKRIYTDWESFARGYLVGRAMWGGSTMALDGLMAIAKELLKDEDSPWMHAAL